MNDEIDWDTMEWDQELGDFVSKVRAVSLEEGMETKDSNGNILESGDTVFLTRDLDVKGSTLNLKRGVKIKNIKTGDNRELIECKIGKTKIFLKTCFLKKI